MTSFWRDKVVFVTGHTGFKGSWLSLMLMARGAKVHGFALAPPTDPALFDILSLRDRLAGHTEGDIRDRKKLSDAVRQARPDVVIHLAAQPIVRESFIAPHETYDVNVMGTVALLEAVRESCETTRVVVNVTTDKCYENQEWEWPYRECDRLGGHDPYSNSKACSELVTKAFRQSFFADKKTRIFTARAGNAIGGGDFAKDRILPDFFRALDKRQALMIRAPESVRPWQHVLEPLSGYLLLAERSWNATDLPHEWNFGPSTDAVWQVRDVVGYLADKVTGAQISLEQKPQPAESRTLQVDSSRARHVLKWSPKWSVSEALDRTLAWHVAYRSQKDMAAFAFSQLEEHETG